MICVRLMFHRFPYAWGRMKPLFVPLMTRYFRDFESGLKCIEYRRYGARWNERACVPGRPVTLSHGYSGARLNARLVSFRAVLARDAADGRETYGPDTMLAVIELELLGPATADENAPQMRIIPISEIRPTTP